MSIRQPGRLRLPPKALCLTALPLVTIVSAGALMQTFGLLAVPSEVVSAAPMADHHGEAAGRIRAMAMWLLLLSISLSCIAFFLLDLRRFTGTTKRLLLRTYLFFAIVGSLLSLSETFGAGERVIGEREICSSLRAIEPDRAKLLCPGDPGAAAERCSTRAWDQRLSDAVLGRTQQQCPTVPQFETLRTVNLIQRVVTPWVTPALVLGAISCLAVGGGRRRLRWRAQAQRLNTYLFLAAAMLVAGLLFMAALLHWPGYSHTGTAAVAYQAHVSAWVLYWGIVYSLFIASYYVPIALRLARSCGGIVSFGRSPGASDGADASVGMIGPLELVTIAAGVFAPAMTGLLGEVFKL